MAEETATMVAESKRAVDEFGIRVLCLKMADRRGWRHDVKNFEAVRKAVGDGVVIGVDPNTGWTLADALSVENLAAIRLRLSQLLLGFGAAGRQSVERLKGSSNPAVRRTAFHVLREFGGAEALPEFEFYGVGRDDGKSGGEYAGIFYRKDRFTRTDASTFWLSATPEKPGTSFYTVPGAVPRIASWVRLRDNRSGRELFVLNAHWDHISAPARRKSAALIRERLFEPLTHSAVSFSAPRWTKAPIRYGPRLSGPGCGPAPQTPLSRAG